MANSSGSRFSTSSVWGRVLSSVRCGTNTMMGLPFCPSSKKAETSLNLPRTFASLLWMTTVLISPMTGTSACVVMLQKVCEENGASSNPSLQRNCRTFGVLDPSIYKRSLVHKLCLPLQLALRNGRRRSQRTQTSPLPRLIPSSPRHRWLRLLVAQGCLPGHHLQIQSVSYRFSLRPLHLR